MAVAADAPSVVPAVPERAAQGEHPPAAARVDPARSSAGLWRRVALGTGLLVGQQAFLLGAAWDIQWHLQVGRDRPLTPPHVLLLAGIVVTGLLALAAVVAHSWPVWRGRPAVGEATAGFLGMLYAPLGAYVAGFGALLSALAFPLDNAWHGLYGLDVTIWSPFHVMIISGMALAGLGTAYVFAPAQWRRDAGPRMSTAGAAGTVLALASVAGVLLIFLAQALDSEGIARVPVPSGAREALLVFPPLLVLLTVPWLVAAAPAGRLPGGATLAALALTAMRLGMFGFVPWAVRAAAAAEHQIVRPAQAGAVATPLAFPGWSVLAAGVVIDLAWWAARSRSAWLPALPAPAPLVAGGLAGSALLAWMERPWLLTLPATRGGRGVDLVGAFGASLPAVAACALAAAVLGVVVAAGLRRAQA